MNLIGQIAILQVSTNETKLYSYFMKDEYECVQYYVYLKGFGLKPFFLQGEFIIYLIFNKK